ncbi:MAG TPA: hypothetical protein VLA88_05545, partial [Candidatus Saccharimonadales bacterium]|nr:hypothetical protein [Candidatus Saccharimonadales bacterium]
VKPYRTGEYVERINLVSEGLAWFNDPGMQFYLNVPDYYAWRPFGIHYSPQNSTLPAGSTVTITVAAQNVGNTTWKKSGPIPMRFATVAPLNRGSIYEHSNWLNSIRPAGLQETSVPPGGVGNFVFTVKVPSTPGEYRERFSLVAENLRWLNDPGFSLYIRSY